MIAREIDRVIYYYIFNEHGDVTQLWSQSGTCKASYEYDAFGIERSPDKEDENPFRYCGEYIDLETNTYYLRARYYRSVTGRFTSEDTLRCVKNKLPNEQEVSDPLSLNLYTYCHSNPVFYTDPTGHYVLPLLALTAIAGLVAGALAGGISSAIQGKFSWKAVAQGAAIGSLVGLTGGAALAYVVTGSALASTGAVAAGLGFGAATVWPAGATGFEQARQLLQVQQMRVSVGAGETVAELTRAQSRNINTLNNIINNNLTAGDFSGTLADLLGKPIPKPGGGFWDHLTEMKQSYTGLQSVKNGLEGSLQNPNLTSDIKVILQENLDKANYYIYKIEELFRAFGGIK
ncbi:MAG: hypothetical protein E7243_11385 [Lacrimispora celerecrescens]|nr:hypothetical protein [Lacrimispora celerecrescens]